jgi:hypothetical protein
MDRIYLQIMDPFEYLECKYNIYSLNNASIFDGFPFVLLLNVVVDTFKKIGINQSFWRSSYVSLLFY